MPEFDYALLCDYVRADAAGVAHAIAAGIDTVYTPQVPSGQNVGLLLRITFTQGECGRPHRLEVFFRDTDGQELAKVEGVVTPEWRQDLPPGWPVGTQAGLNFGIPLPAYGLYSFEILINDSLVKSLNLRVVPPQEASS